MPKSTKSDRPAAPRPASRKPAGARPGVMAANGARANGARVKRTAREVPATSTPSAALRSQAKAVVRGLAKTYPDATCALKHRSAYELLVATILSAQCTDERVNLVTPALFANFPDAKALAGASQSELEQLIRSAGFFRAKAKSLRGMAAAVVEHFGGQIPKSLEELVTLPGVGRKTASVVLGTIWRIASGIVVDTHVRRITNLLGLTTASTPEQIELDLMRLIPQNEWVNFSHRLIHHGRRICIARRPKCRECPLLPSCKRVGLPPLD